MRPRKVILSVDDNEQVLSVRKFMLETRGYRVVSATHPARALELLESGGVDLVLSDLLMPTMDGNEMVRRMKQFAPEVPMLLVSGTVKGFERADAADSFLPKGAGSAHELLDRIRMLLARKRGPKKAANPTRAAGEASGEIAAAHVPHARAS
jgi:CheY-like chemotaxis protein